MISIRTSMRMFVTGILLISAFLTIDCRSIDQMIADAADSNILDLVFDEHTRILRTELDILMSIDEYTEIQREKMAIRRRRRGKRKAIRSPRRRWTNKRVPFEIDGNTFSRTEMRQINSSISEWNKETCLKFQPSRVARNRIKFQNGDGCSSFVGMTGGVQTVNLARGCRIKRIIVHEIGHAVGFQHEQSRPDRDGFVEIIEKNIPKPVLFNFDSLPSSRVNNFEVPYDYRSVMHYGATAFSINGGLTVRTKDRRFQNIIGNAPGLSFKDIKLANLMYKCNERCPRKKCPVDGFQGKDCSCKCASNNPNNPVQNCESVRVMTARPQMTTPRTTTTRTTDCADRLEFCKRFASLGHCTRSRGFMSMYCKGSCGLCRDGNQANVCQDYAEHCEFWSKQNYCKMKFVSYMERNCPKTCGYCTDVHQANSQNNNDVLTKCRAARQTIHFCLIMMLMVPTTFVNKIVEIV